MILSAVGKRIGLGNSHLALNDAVRLHGIVTISKDPALRALPGAGKGTGDRADHQNPRNLHAMPERADAICTLGRPCLPSGGAEHGAIDLRPPKSAVDAAAFEKAAPARMKANLY